MGDPMRFIYEVAVKHDGDGCLTWPFTRDTNGYGQVKIGGGRRMGAHRYVCKLIRGEPPTPTHEAAHSCGKGHEACVSGAHLTWKTPVENASDRITHGTQVRGVKSPKTMLTEAQVVEVLRLKGIKTQARIAKEYGVSRYTISDIHRGKNWAWVGRQA